MAASRSLLSVGRLVREILMDSPEVVSRTRKIFPVVVDKADLPYILYRRAGMDHDSTKAGRPGPLSVQVEVLCFTANYEDGVELAEAVRDALDNLRCTSTNDDAITLSSSTLVDCEEAWQDDAYVQQLTFNIRN